LPSLLLAGAVLKLRMRITRSNRSGGPTFKHRHTDACEADSATLNVCVALATTSCPCVAEVFFRFVSVPTINFPSALADGVLLEVSSDGELYQVAWQPKPAGAFPVPVIKSVSSDAIRKSTSSEPAAYIPPHARGKAGYTAAVVSVFQIPKFLFDCRM